MKEGIFKVAKNNNKKANKIQTKEEVAETQVVEQKAEVVEAIETKQPKASKPAKEDKSKDKKKKQSKASEPKKRSRIKETFSELKKVTWPSFGKAMKQTGMVLAIVLVFGVLVLGIDLLIGFIINLLSLNL